MTDRGIGSGNLLLPLIVIGLLVLLGGVLLARSKGRRACRRRDRRDRRFGHHRRSRSRR